MWARAALPGGSAAQPAADIVARLDATAVRLETPCGAGSIIWRSWGSGPALVLLHGGIGSWRHWVRTISHFAAHRRVIAPDTPGLGDSATAPPPHTPPQIAAWLGIGLTSVLGEERCDLAGFSFGALLAGHIAAQRPDLVATLTLAGPGALGLKRGDVPLVRVLDKTGDERVEAHRTNLLRLMLARPGSADALALTIQDTNTRLARVRSVPFASTTSLRDALARVTAPVHAIWGEADAVAAPDLPGRIAAIRAVQPRAQVTLIPSAGHWVAYEAPEAFCAALTAGLAA
jgi:pimeloyl-ACP methyl ester carboxylesterase